MTTHPLTPFQRLIRALTPGPEMLSGMTHALAWTIGMIMGFVLGVHTAWSALG